MIRIILAEDHNIVRNGIRNLLEKEKDLKVIGEALNGQEVIDLLNTGLKADIIMADVNMPLMSGIEMSEKVSNEGARPKIVILSMLDHERYVLEAFQAGASGYLLKNISADELIFALRHIHVDGRYICSELALRFLDKLLKEPEPTKSGTESAVQLSTREIEVLMLVADGLTNQEIADKLFTSKRTIEGNRQILLEKTGTRNTAALIRYALQRGIIN
ncbi:response regulator transcription factor [Mucilaginibacter auburnensis]|uniref:DNA-binding NarL/FixJ family response regulator n=1 Tax=Mucilaginibacter auburnensis TaxID=1457233 RepID=A0A2H9VMI6_9SPHI|nr:response regulator transcription factor [Mucilaginibacter auburnensis]PJJ79551.1 DNA-binding NarL/FixJ family response regulator [Mucilaginibacter auburnensis]